MLNSNLRVWIGMPVETPYRAGIVESSPNLNAPNQEAGRNRMEKIAAQVSKFDKDVSVFLNELGLCLQHYRGPALGDSIDQIANNMGQYGQQLVTELARRVRAQAR